MSIKHKQAKPVKNRFSMTEFQKQLAESVALSSRIEPKSSLKRAAAVDSGSEDELPESISARRPSKRVKVEHEQSNLESDVKEEVTDTGVGRFDAAPESKAQRNASDDGAEADRKKEHIRDTPESANGGPGCADASPERKRIVYRCGLCREIGHTAPKCKKKRARDTVSAKATRSTKREPAYEDAGEEEEPRFVSPALEE